MRVRIRFTERGKVRFISHRDMARCFERAIRKASLPIAYSEGFSPRPKFHYGLALSVGHESDAEFLDLDLTERVEPNEVADRLNAGLPDGINIVAACEVERSATALQAVIGAVTWRIWFDNIDASALRDRRDDMMKQDQIPLMIERKGKTINENVRPMIAELTVFEGTDGTVSLTALLNTKPRSLRPRELTDAIGNLPEPTRVERLEQWITNDGPMHSPLLGPVTSPHMAAP